MSIFKRKPKIIKGHSFDDYLKHYSKGYITATNDVVDNKKKLKANARYYEINGKYYQIDHSRLIKNILIGIGSLSLVTTIYLPIHFTIVAAKERYQDYAFKYWNECDSLNNLKEFVKTTVTPGNKDYVPKEDRLAVFDMDGTLFGERSQIYIEWMMYQDYYDQLAPGDPRGINPVKVPDKRITAEYFNIYPEQVYEGISKFREGINDDITDDHGHAATLEMAEAYAGAQLFSTMSVVGDYTPYVEQYLQRPAEIFNNLLYKDMFYKPMEEVVEFLHQNNFIIYIVSGTDRYMVRQIMSHYPTYIAPNRIIGMDVSTHLDETTGLIMRDDELKYKNVEKVKPELIAQEIYNWPILSFGNSSGDIAMHHSAKSNPKYHHLEFMNVADDVERERGYEGEELEKRIAGWADNYQLFSMKNDWKTIYGDNVTRKK